MEQDYLKAFYEDHCDEDARLRSRHGMVEFLTTMRYIEKYLKQGDRILEIGAGTGRYSHALAQKGYAVDAVELLEHNINVFRQNTLPAEPVTIRQGNALDLSGFGDETYDLTLLLGPMYHLFTVDDQRKALTEAIRVTKPGGVVFAAYCGSDATAIQYCFVRGMFKDPHYRALADPATFKLSSDPAEVFALHRREEIDALMENLPVERLHFVGTDMATGYMRDTIDQMDDELYELYLQYHFATCERADLVGASNHYLDIFKKR
ncbi:MAG: class I SAM-dependent methyltransferase [Oscillospiraceae bacterium]|nr:class I SAM-dependent methyltransferase [Oscillospiraceae bacterium]MDE7172026.1 class I SAM-dependent methyltransferase [Oscillospiraceae bacterium]